MTGTTLTWTCPTLQPGAAATLSYTVTVNAGAYNQTLRNVATPGPGWGVHGGGGLHDHASHAALCAEQDQQSGVRVDGEPGRHGHLHADGHERLPAVLTGAVVTDDLADVLDNATIGTVGAGGTLAGTTLTWAVPDAGPGRVATLSYSVTVNADAYNLTSAQCGDPGPGW